MEETTPHIQIKIPTKDSPGFLRRQRRVMQLAEAWETGRRDPKLIDDIVDFFADYVTEPPTRQQAIEALWEASENQLEELMNLFRGNAPSLQETNSAASISGS